MSSYLELITFTSPVIIPLFNSGFETPEQTNAPVPDAGFFDFETPPGWELYDPKNLIPEDASLATSFTGGWKPSDAFFPTIPEGEQIGSIFLVPPGAGKVGFAQDSGKTIQPKTIYTLSAAVLNTPGLPGVEMFEGFPGYELQLLAGDTVIATHENELSIAEGEFEIATVSYISANDDPYLGEDLRIRLVNPNLDNSSGLDGGNGIEVNFDDVQLTSTSVRAGYEIIKGTPGNDSLDGGKGKDLFAGGLDKDLLTGGNDPDLFVLGKGEGIDTIIDFKHPDLISLTGGIGFSDLCFSGEEILLTSTSEVLATLTGVDSTTLNDSDFTTV